MTHRHLRIAASSDQGLVRSNNEDSAVASSHLLALADGMGGHAAGEIASQLMIRSLVPLAQEALPDTPEELCALLNACAIRGNNAIAAHTAAEPDTQGMGTTLTALLFDGSCFALHHVGDSRCYRLRDNTLTQLTVDDTFVQSLVDKGELAPEDACVHPKRSLILKAYTGFPVDPHVEILDAQPGDRLLLCSDGLSDPVSFDTIETTLRNADTPKRAAEYLTELALRSGGPDNITMVIADVVSEDSADDDTDVLLVGAINPHGADLNEDFFPDTSARRAALLRAHPVGHDAQPEVIPARAPEETPSISPDDGDTRSSRRTHKKIRSLWLILILVIILAALGGGAWWFHTAGNNTYEVKTQDDTLVIEKGLDIEIFGHSLHSVHQVACLSSDAQPTVRLISPDAAASNTECIPFRMSDLEASARAEVATLPSGSYDDVVEQLQRLAEQTLPLCSVSANSSSHDTDDQHDAGQVANTPGSLNKPGENCRVGGNA